MLQGLVILYWDTITSKYNTLNKCCFNVGPSINVSWLLVNIIFPPSAPSGEWVNDHNHGNIATEGSPKSGMCPSLMEWLQGLFIVHSTIDSTAHSRPLNSLEHCIQYAKPQWQASVPAGIRTQYYMSFEPRAVQMNHRPHPLVLTCYDTKCDVQIAKGWHQGTGE